jgi:hypothetical protein
VTLFDRKEWPPAQNVRNSKALPTFFGNVAWEGNAGITRAEVLNLISTLQILQRRLETGLQQEVWKAWT